VRLLVVGAGGHAKVVIDAAQAAGFDVVGAIGDPQKAATVCGIHVAPTAEGIDADGFIIAVGDNRARAELYSAYLASGLAPTSVIHPSAIIAPSVEVGSGTLIAAGVVVNTDAVIGENAILNTSCSVDHDCAIGTHAHVGPMSGLCGAVRVGTGTLIGVGCSLIPGVTVGDWSVLGAGSVVVDDLAADTVFAGVPARPLRPSEESA